MGVFLAAMMICVFVVCLRTILSELSCLPKSWPGYGVCSALTNYAVFRSLLDMTRALQQQLLVVTRAARFAMTYPSPQSFYTIYVSNLLE